VSVINLRRRGRHLAEIERSRRVRAVLFNGQDVTRRCFMFDTRIGRARLYATLPGTDQKFVDPVTREAAWYEVRGRVVVRWNRAA
jgi:hypothetical protein